MSAFIRMAVALGIGASLCAAGATTAYAQSATAPAYVILEFTVKDPDGFKEYAQRAPATVQQHGGKFLVRPGEILGERRRSERALRGRRGWSTGRRPARRPF